MKPIAALLALLMIPAFTAYAADPAPKDEREKQIHALVKEVQAQQALIAQNQVQIEAKLGAVAESVRVARIYSSRGGRKGK